MKVFRRAVKVSFELLIVCLLLAGWIVALPIFLVSERAIRFAERVMFKYIRAIEKRGEGPSKMKKMIHKQISNREGTFMNRTQSIFANKTLLNTLALVLLLPACQTDNFGGGTQIQSWGGGETFGTLGGAAAGGLIGSQFGHGTGNIAATLGGVLLGGFLGNRAGAMIDEGDRAAAARAERRAYTAPVGQQISWNNPRNGNYGMIVPVRDGYANSGAFCREFQQTIVVGGKQQQGFGTVCQQPDGSWKIIQ